uniref:PNPLA domain-containing protein n=1 Tax=candidate division WOR-3 bacterium TaxID=2052148 RepID=A0A7C6EII3_UNCW3
MGHIIKMIKFLLLFLVFFNQALANDTKDNDSLDLRIGIAFSAGGALGLAHIGVLKVFEKEHIPISFVTGTSMGALIGGAYAAGFNATQIESIALSIDWSELLKPTKPFGTFYLTEREKKKRYIFELRHKNFIPILPRGIIPLQNVEFFLMEIFSEPSYYANYNFDSLPLPYRAIAVDLNSKKPVALKNGRLDKAIRASIAIPGIFSSVRIDGMELIDGGVHRYLPAEELFEFEPDFIIGVVTIKNTTESRHSVLDVVSRTMNILGAEDLHKQKNYADVIIEPDLQQFEPSDFSRVKEIIKAGEAAAIKSLPEIKEKIKNRRLTNVRKVKSYRPAPKVHSIRFKGLKTTKVSTLNRILKTRTNEYLNFKILVNDLKRIFQTGLFYQVDYELDFKPDDSVDVIIIVDEPYYGVYLFGVCYDNENGLATGFEIGQNNLFGTGIDARSALSLGNPNEFRTGITGTRIFLLPFSYLLDGFWGVKTNQLYKNNTWITDYSTVYRGGIFRIGYAIGNNSFFDTGIKGKQAIYHIPPIPWKDSIPEKEWIVYPFLNWEFNNFDDFYVPTKGLKATANFDYSNPMFLSDSNFIKLQISFNHYLNIRKFMLIQYGIEIGLSNGGLPWAEYFYTDGEEFVGFDKDEFVSQQRIILSFGIEFKVFELFSRPDYPVFLGTICNAGTFNSVSSDLTKSPHYGVGVLLRANTPVGPINFILGIGDFNKNKENIRSNLYISVGRDFRYRH